MTFSSALPLLAAVCQQNIDVWKVMRRLLVELFAALSLLHAGCALSRGTLNPDVRQDTIAETICVPGYTKTVRPSTSYTGGVKRKLLREANRSELDGPEYELDHIIPLALGGHPRKMENLEIQLWEGENGAIRKDRIEVKLQCLVCSGQVALADAQEQIATDWQAAYHRYARTKCRRFAEGE